MLSILNAFSLSPEVPHGFGGRNDAMMIFDKLIVGSHGRAKAGPYSYIQPAEAGGGRYRCPSLLGGLATLYTYDCAESCWMKKSKIIIGPLPSGE